MALSVLQEVQTAITGKPQAEAAKIIRDRRELVSAEINERQQIAADLSALLLAVEGEPVPSQVGASFTIAPQPQN